MVQRFTRSTFTSDRVKSATVDWLLRRGKVRFLARGASPRHAQSLPRVGRGWEGLCSRSTVAGDRVTAGTLSAGQTPVISGSCEVERARRSTVDFYGGFIGAGAGNSAGSALA